MSRRQQRPLRTISTRRRPVHPDDEGDNEEMATPVPHEAGPLVPSGPFPSTEPLVAPVPSVQVDNLTTHELTQRLVGLEGTVNQILAQLTAHFPPSTPPLEEQAHSSTAGPSQPSAHIPTLVEPVRSVDNMVGTMRNAPAQMVPIPLQREQLLSHYEGKISWEEYQVHLDVTSQANQWTLQTKRERLANSLRGPALSVLADLREDERMNYFFLTSALAEQFGRARLQPNYCLQLKTRKQKPQESLSDLANDIEKLVRGAYSDESREHRGKKGVEVFIDALSNRELAKLITLSKPATIQNAVDTALQLEAIGSSVSTTLIDHNRCFKCNSLGHFKAQCPKRARQNPEN